MDTPLRLKPRLETRGPPLAPSAQAMHAPAAANGHDHSDHPESERSPRAPRPESPRSPRDPRSESPRSPRDPRPESPRSPRDPRPESPRSPRDPSPESPKPSPPDSPKSPSAASAGTVIVRLAADLPLPSRECTNLTDAARELGLKSLQRWLTRYQVYSERLIRNVPQDSLLNAEREARLTELPPLHSLAAYWRLNLAEFASKLDEMVARLNDFDGVEAAYAVPANVLPSVDASDDKYSGEQRHLDPEPVGIDARYAWQQPGGAGEGVAFADVELGWNMQHEDIVGQKPTLISGSNINDKYLTESDPEKRAHFKWLTDHGTSVVGIVAAQDNKAGVVGVAPHCKSIQLAAPAATIADAIVAAALSLDVGDVLLIESAWGDPMIPREVLDADFDAIRLAVSRGIIVIECAGNSEVNLDTLTYPEKQGKRLLNPDRDNKDFRDSGAIMVGAAKPTVPHDTVSTSNSNWGSSFGGRVDCYAHGEYIMTCGYGLYEDTFEDGYDREYTHVFNGTSGAGAIIAGAAVAVQGMYRAATGSRLSPLQMRSILSDPATGTPQGAGGRIGVMPDLKAIGERLRLVPDVFLRDWPGDTGVVPHSGPLSQSPDIIVRRADEAVADPNAAWGAGSGLEDSYLNVDVHKGAHYKVYVRAKNRGGTDAAAVVAKVFWSDCATLLTRNAWHLIGTTAAMAVPSGGTLRVSAPLEWQANVPLEEGHYCFIALLHAATDGAPVVPEKLADFLDFARNNNNVSFRNFNTVPILKSVEKRELRFNITGAPDGRYDFDFVIEQQLARGVRVWLQVPHALGRVLLEGTRWEHKNEEGGLQLLLPVQPHIFIPQVSIGKAARLLSFFMVTGLASSAVPGNRLSICQLYNGHEVGRVTWSFELEGGNSTGGWCSHCGGNVGGCQGHGHHHCCCCCHRR